MASCCRCHWAAFVFIVAAYR